MNNQKEIADAVRDLAAAIRLLMGDEPHENVDVMELRERLSQIRPRQER